jgi:hypothetical protein
MGFRYNTAYLASVGLRETSTILRLLKLVLLLLSLAYGFFLWNRLKRGDIIGARAPGEISSTSQLASDEVHGIALALNVEVSKHTFRHHIKHH